MFCHMALERADVSDEHIAWLNRVEKHRWSRNISPILSPWWLRWNVLANRRFLREPHGVIFQKTEFFFSLLIFHTLDHLRCYNPERFFEAINHSDQTFPLLYMAKRRNSTEHQYGISNKIFIIKILIFYPSLQRNLILKTLSVELSRTAEKLISSGALLRQGEKRLVETCSEFRQLVPRPPPPQEHTCANLDSGLRNVKKAFLESDGMAHQKCWFKLPILNQP
jgi:hypothetical protein